jgi:hypothetical protein
MITICKACHDNEQLARTLGMNPKMQRNPEKGFVLKANPFRVGTLYVSCPRVLASSNPGLKLANAFGVLSNWTNTSRFEGR